MWDRCRTLSFVFVLLAGPFSFAQENPVEDITFLQAVERNTPPIRFFDHGKLGEFEVTVADKAADGDSYALAGFDRTKGRDSDAWKSHRVPGRLGLWDATTRRQLRKFHGDFGAINDVAIDGTTVVTVGKKLGKDGTELLVWDSKTGNSRKLLEEFHVTTVDIVGNRIAAGTDRGGIIVTNLDGEVVQQIGPGFGRKYRIRLGVEGKLLSTSSWAGPTYCFDLKDVSKLELPDSSQLKSTAIEFSPAGDLLAYAYEFEDRRFVDLVSTRTWQVARSVEVGGFISQISFNDSGTLFATTGNDRIRVFGAGNGELLGVYQRRTSRSDESILLLGDSNPVVLTSFRGSVSYGRLSIPNHEQEILKRLDKAGVQLGLGIRDGKVRVVRADLSNTKVDAETAQAVLRLDKLDVLRLDRETTNEAARERLRKMVVIEGD